MMVQQLMAAVAACALYTVSAEVFLEENFDTFDESKWVHAGSHTSKEDEKKASTMGKFVHTAGEWNVDAEVAKGIQTSEDMKHYAISAPLTKAFSNEGKPMVVQFSVKNEKKETSFCGGGYIKIHPSGLDQEKYGGEDKYNVMFGPDLCGYDVSRVHLIFRDQKDNNLLKKEDIKLEYDDKNEFTHLYTLILNPDGTYEVLFDGKEKSKGSLLEGWDFPSKEIDDATDTKPADWVEEQKILDPADVKPEGHDDIKEKIPDPEATKPAEWDEDMDGEWEPATISNPEFKGAWVQKEIDNPEYKGEFKPKQVANPDYSDKVGVYEDNAFVGFELWTVNSGSIFDNILVTDDVEYAKAQADKLFKPTSEGEKDAKKAWEDSKKPAEEPKKEDAAADAAADEGVEEVKEEEEKKDEL